MFHVRAIWLLMGQVFLGVLLGVLGLLFFIAYDAQAMIIDNTQVEIRDSDIIGTELDLTDIGNQYVKIQYIGNWKDTINIDEIGTNFERVGNTYKIWPGQQYYKNIDLWFEVKYATTTLVEFNKATQGDEILGLLRFIIPIAKADIVLTDTDGMMRRNVLSDWTTLVNGNGVLIDNGAVAFVGWKNSVSSGWGSGYRSRFSFDLDPFEIDDETASASIFIWGSSHSDNTADDPNFHLLDLEPNSDDTLAITDYENSGTIDYSSTTPAFSAFILGGYQRFPMAQTGLDEINDNMDDYFHVSAKTSNDYLDVSPTDEASTDTELLLPVTMEGTIGQRPFLLIDLEEEEEEEATSTPSVSIPCDLVPNNELSMAVWCVEEWGDSTTSPEKTFYGYAHIPFLVWFIIMVPTLWLAGRLLLEFIIRLRRY